MYHVLANGCVFAVAECKQQPFVPVRINKGIPRNVSNVDMSRMPSHGERRSLKRGTIDSD